MFTISDKIWNVCGEAIGELYIFPQVLSAQYDFVFIHKISESTELKETIISGERYAENTESERELSILEFNRMECMDKNKK